MEFVEGGKIVGVDPDIAEALGKQLGVKMQFTAGDLRRPDHLDLHRP